MALPLINNQPQNAPTMGDADQKKKRQQGTGFANIGRILQANQGAGQQLGQKVGSTISGQAEEVRKGIESGKQQFQAGKQESVAQAGQKLNPAESLKRQENEDQAAYESRLAGLQNAEQVGQGLREAQYTGPQTLQNEASLQAKSANAAALARLAGQGASGQDMLLRNVVGGRGGYSRGESALDRLLLGREGQQNIQQARASASGIQGEAQRELMTAQQQAQLAQKQIEERRKSATENIMSTLGGGENTSGLIDTAKAATAQQNKDLARIQEILRSDERDLKLTDEDIKLLDRAGEYGLADTKIYTGDEAALKTSLQNLASGINQQDALKFKGSQQQAAVNLAKILGDQSKAKSLESNQFDMDAIKEQAAMFDPAAQAAINDPELAQRAANVEAMKQLSGIARQYTNPAEVFANSKIGQIGATNNFWFDRMNSAYGDQNKIFEPLERLMPGIRAQVDQDPYSVLGLDWRQWDVNSNAGKKAKEVLKKMAYNKIASDPAVLARFENERQQRQNVIGENTKSIFDAIKERFTKLKK